MTWRAFVCPPGTLGGDADMMLGRLAAALARGVMASSQKGPRKYYAVRSGHNPGVYRSWAECEEQVCDTGGAHRRWNVLPGALLSLGPDHFVIPAPSLAQVKGVSGAIHKSFATRAAAEAFVKGQEPRSVSRKAAGTGKTSGAAAGPAPKRRRSSTTTASGDDDEAFVLRFDGGARGNPGPSGSGALVLLPGGLQVVARTRRFLGTYSTNNEAEYDALITGLKLASKLRPPVRSLREEGGT